MRMPDALLLCALGAAAFGISGARGEGTNLGKPIAPSDIAMWDIDVEPDGTGLPAGGGSSDQGAAIFAEKGRQENQRHRRIDNDHRQLLALRHDVVRLHSAGDAMDRAAVAFR
jgi:hypothetical protein